MRTAVASDRGKNYFAFSFWGEIILRAFPTGTLRPCKRGIFLVVAHISLSAFHSGTPNKVKKSYKINL